MCSDLVSEEEVPSLCSQTCHREPRGTHAPHFLKGCLQTPSGRWTASNTSLAHWTKPSHLERNTETGQMLGDINEEIDKVHHIYWQNYQPVIKICLTFYRLMVLKFESLKVPYEHHCFAGRFCDINNSPPNQTLESCDNS